VPKNINSRCMEATLYSAEREWLQSWIEHIEKMIDPKDIKARIIDFNKPKFFFFTDCSDIIGKDAKGESPETSKKVFNKKQWAFLWLFLKYLIGDTDHINENWKICKHCGGKNCRLEGFKERVGHYNFCPDCGRIKAVTYAGDGFYIKAMGEVAEVCETWNKGGTPEYANDAEEAAMSISPSILKEVEKATMDSRKKVLKKFGIKKEESECHDEAKDYDVMWRIDNHYEGVDTTLGVCPVCGTHTILEKHSKLCRDCYANGEVGESE